MTEINLLCAVVFLKTGTSIKLADFLKVKLYPFWIRN